MPLELRILFRNLIDNINFAMYVWLIFSAMFGAAFGAVFEDPSQAGKKHCTYEGHKIKLNTDFQPPGQCMKLSCYSDFSGKRVAMLSGMSCGISEYLIQGEKEKKYIKPQPSPDLPYPKCCPIKYRFVPEKKPKSGKKKGFRQRW